MRLVLSSSSGMANSDARAQELGFDAALPKPIRRSHMLAAMAQVLGAAVETPQRPEGTPAPAPIASGAGYRVLVVDDVKVNQRLVSVMLSALGMRIDLAANGREALQAVESLPYDLVLMDVQMPEMDGLEATRQIRALAGPVNEVPIVAMTANAMIGDREKCLQAGMNDYISKPIDKAKLIERVCYWLGEDEECADGAAPLGAEGQPQVAAQEEAPTEAAMAALEDLIGSVDGLDGNAPDLKKARN